jgi:hypothetical protein
MEICAIPVASSFGIFLQKIPPVPPHIYGTHPLIVRFGLDFEGHSPREKRKPLCYTSPNLVPNSEQPLFLSLRFFFVAKRYKMGYPTLLFILYLCAGSLAYSTIPGFFTTSNTELPVHVSRKKSKKAKSIAF